MWAVLDRGAAGWRGFSMTPAAARLLADLRHSLHDPPTQPRQPNSTPDPQNAAAPPDSTAIA
ncbi:MAG: hypothetical protein WBR28_24880, partial [Mycobacterium sp.]